jgi:hypothetical protein
MAWRLSLVKRINKMKLKYRSKSGLDIDILLATLLLFIFFMLPVFMGLIGIGLLSMYDILLYVWFKLWYSLITLFFWLLPFSLPQFQSWLPSFDAFMAVLLLPSGLYLFLTRMKERELVPVAFSFIGASLIWLGGIMTGIERSILLWKPDYADIASRAAELLLRWGAAEKMPGIGAFLLLLGEGILLAGLVATMIVLAAELVQRRFNHHSIVLSYSMLPAIAAMIWLKAWVPAALLVFLWALYHDNAQRYVHES